MDATHIELGNPLVWAGLDIKFMLLQMNLMFVPKDLAELSVEAVRLKVKEMLPLLKGIHHHLSSQASIQELLAQDYVEMENQIKIFDKNKTRCLLRLKVSSAQLAGDDEQEKHWQQMLDDAWIGEVRPVVTREYLLAQRAGIQNWRATFADSPLMACPNFSRRIEAIIPEYCAIFTELLPFADLEAQGLEVDKKLKAEITLRYPTPPIEFCDTIIEGFEYLQHPILTHKTKLQNMQERFELRIADLATLLAHIYKSTHASDWRKRTPWWKKRHGPRMLK